MEEWKSYKLGDVITVLDYKRVPLSSKERESRKGIYPYYGAQGIIDYIDDFIFDGEYLLIAEDGENLKSQKQNVAQIARGKYWVNNHAHIVESNGKCDIRYICYLLNSMDLSGYITGSAQPKLNQANLLAIELNLPDLYSQIRIADMLSKFDDKISINNRINHNLEEQAQALYKSWFIDYEPFKEGEFVASELGMIPEGWHVGTLSEIADITMGQSPSGSSFNEEGQGIAFYQGRTEFGYRFPSIKLFTTEPTRFAEPHSVLMSVRAPVGDINVALDRCCIGRGLAAITARDEAFSFVLYTLKGKSSELDLYNGEGTVFGSINRKDLEGLSVLIPPKYIIQRFNDCVRPIDDSIEITCKEIVNLSISRDSLLPRLMSGQLSFDVFDS